MKRLSKSRLMASLQCPKRVYFEVHHPELRQISASTQAAFDTGHAVGEVAQAIYGEGDFLEYEGGLGKALGRTKELMRSGSRRPIYEATLQHEGVLVRTDVLLPQECGRWRIVEVKASSSLKEEHVIDCAIQAWVFAGAGYEIESIALAHVDNGWVYPGGGDYRGLLVEEELAGAVEDLLDQVPLWVERAKAALEAKPEQRVGGHCFSPYECPFVAQCWPMDAEYPLLGLGGKKDDLAALVHEGYDDLRQVPEARLQNEKQRRIRRVSREGAPELLPAAADFARRLAFPRYFLDFETIGPPLPIWPGTRPYEALPVQWSCLVEESPGELRHEDFLELSAEPPMRPLAEALLHHLGDEGPILAYSSYERRVIKDLAERFPDLERDLLSLLERLVDLLPVARDYYYHPRMLGSWSIKAVLPTIAPDLAYEELEGVQEGTAAGSAYLEAIRPETSPERRAEIHRQLVAYCRLDTEAMRRLLELFAGG